MQKTEQYRDIQHLLDIPQNKKLLLYGAGFFSEAVTVIIENAGITKVSGFVVSDGYRTTATLCERPVYELSELKQSIDEYYFLVVAGARFHEQVIHNLKAAGAHAYTFISVEQFQLLSYYSYEKYFTDAGIDTTGQTLCVGGLEVLNPFNAQFPLSQVASAVCEMGDIVLPSLLGEHRFIFEGAYELGEVAICAGDVVLDCGANIGLFSALAAYKGGQVHAFEPVQDNIDLLRQLCLRYLERITVEPMAVAGQNGNLAFCVAKELAASSLQLYTNKLEGNEAAKVTGEITVQVTTIDSFVRERGLTHVDFIKADIEGAERDMLAGATDTLARFAPKLAICTYHYPEDPKLLEELILKANPRYRITHRWKKLFAYVPKGEV